MKRNDGFCYRLQKLRERRRVKRSVMSELCGFRSNVIGKFERGERIPRADQLATMAEYLGVTIDYLWFGE